MNIDYTLTRSTNSDISFIDFNKFLNYIIFEKTKQVQYDTIKEIYTNIEEDVKNTIIEYFSENLNDLGKIKQYNENILDEKTKKYVQKISKKYNYEDLLELSVLELREIRVQIYKDFQNNYKIIKEKNIKLKLIQKILKIDLSYYEKQIKNINKILKNEDFKDDIEKINDKIINSEKITNDEMKKMSFFKQLQKQEHYIKYVILSTDNTMYSNNKTEIKNKIVEEMKSIEDETKIYLKDKNLNEKIDYNKVMNLWQENQLKKLLSQIDTKIVDDKKLMNLKYQLIEAFKKLTGKSYDQIHLIMKDSNFKEKIFGDIDIKVIDNKLNQIHKDLEKYEHINQFLIDTKTPIYVCPICNFNSEIPIQALLHLAEHENQDKLDNQTFYMYKDNNKQLRSKYSENIFQNQNTHFYEMKKKLLKSNTIEDYILYTKNPIRQMRQINVQQIKRKVDKEAIFEQYRDNLLKYHSDAIKFFPSSKKIIDIIETRVNHELNIVMNNELFGDDEDFKNFAKLNKIINYHVFRLIFKEYFNDNDISNLYNTNVQYFDNNLKNNRAFDSLFKNIIHYDTFEPIEKIKETMNDFINIIKNNKSLEQMLFADSSNKTYQKISKNGDFTTGVMVADVEVTEYINYKTLMMLIPILRNRNFSLTIQDLIKSEDFEINEDEDKLHNPWEWVQKADYNKMLNLISNIKKTDINIKLIENDESDDYKRLQQLFQNISNAEIKHIQKEFNLITNMFYSLLRQNRVVHNINDIDNEKDINGKYKEYIIGTYLKASLNILNKIVKKNTDNTSNTKNEIFQMFNILKIYLNKDSKYLQKNLVNYNRNIVRNNNDNDTEEKNNKDDILNDFFESDEEYDELEDNFEQEFDDELNDIYSDNDEDFIDDDEGDFDDLF
jgi:hypothetical protein